MKTILYMALSADGFIAGEHDETPWSDAEWKAFQEFVKTCDVVLLGRRTYEIMRQDGDFMEGPEYVVATDNPNADTGSFRKMSIKRAEDVPQAERVAIVGGGELNGRLAALNVINEIILDIEPVVLFGGHSLQLTLELIGTRTIGQGTIQHHYKVM